MKQSIWISLTLPALLSTQLMAGVVYEIEVTDHEQTPPTASSSEISVEGSSLKMNIAPGASGGSGGEMIWRGDRREMVIVDHDEKAYMVMDEQTMKSMAQQMAQVSAQMEEALKNVPPEQRAMMEKMMKDRMPQQNPQIPVIEIRQTSESTEINGYPCDKAIILSDGQQIRRMCVADWDEIEGGDETAEVFQEMSAFFSEMMASFSHAAGGMGGGDFGGGAFEQLSELGGFPVFSEELGADGSLESESTLRSARRQGFEADAFEPPAGYKRRSMGPQ